MQFCGLGVWWMSVHDSCAVLCQEQRGPLEAFIAQAYPFRAHFWSMMVAKAIKRLFLACCQPPTKEELNRLTPAASSRGWARVR